MSTRFKTFIVLNITVFAVAYAWGADYIVKPGETLSTIAHQFISGRVYGTHGSLNQVLALNPKLGSNPNLIFVGQKIEVPTAQTLTEVPDSLIRNPASENLPNQNSNAQVASKTESAPVVSKANEASGDEYEEHSVISIAPLFSFSRINATDRLNGAQSTLGSAMNFGAELGWRQYWSPSFQTALIMSAASNSYSTTSALTLNHSSFLLGSVELEGRLGLLSAPQLIAHVGAIQTPFVRGDSATSNTLDVVSTPNVGLGFAVPLYHSKVFLLSFEGAADYLAPSSESSYAVNSGYAVGGKLSLSQHSKKDPTPKIEGDLFFRYQDQNTSITTQNDLEIGACLKFNFDLFGEKGSQ